MRKTDKLPVKQCVGAEPAGGHAHAAVKHAVARRLRAVVFLKVCDELPRRARQFKLLRQSAVCSPAVEYLFFCGDMLKAHEHGGGVTVGHGNAYALRCDERRFGGNYHAVLYATPYAKRLALALFFLAAYVGDNIVGHLGPFAEGLARAGDRLIGRCDNGFYPEFAQRRKHRNIRLDRAVWLYRNKSAARAEPRALMRNDLGV